MEKIGFVIDNTSIIDKEEFDKYRIYSSFDLKTYTDDDLEISRDFSNDYNKYYKYLEENNQFGKTSTASLGDIKNAIEEALKYCDKVIVLPTMSNVSSTYNNAVIVSKQWGDRVRVVDTCSVVGATYYLIKYANELIDSNIEFDELVSTLSRKAENNITYIIISSFDALVKNGRIGKAKSQVASLLNIKAIVSLSYKGVEIDSKFRTYNKAFKYLRDVVVNTIDEKYELISGNIFNEDMNSQFKNLFPENINIKNIDIPPIIGLHGGVGLIGVSFFKK